MNDSACESLLWYHWPFKIISDTVKNAVQCLFNIGSTIRRPRSRSNKDVIDGVVQVKADIQTITNTAKVYNPN